MLRRREFVALLGGSTAAALSGCQQLRRSGAAEPALDVPGESSIGEPFTVDVSGAPAGSEVVIEATAMDVRDRELVARFHAVAGSEGTARATATSDGGSPGGDDGQFAVTRTDSSSAEPVSRGLDAGGPPRMPLAAMEPVEDPSGPFVANGRGGTLDRVEVAVSADVDGASREATTVRTLVDDGLAEAEVPADGPVGRVHEPASGGPHPGVLVLHGSFGRVPRRFARMLASNGLSVLALRYVGGPGLPSTLDDVPLEYFDRAVSYLLGRDEVVDGRVGLVGLSRGVEAALLTAAAFEGRMVVVGYSGSGLVLPGIDASGGLAGSEAAWTRGGEAIVPAEPVERVLPAIPSSATTAGALDAALDELATYEETARVGVPVEEIEGPVLLLSGQRDALWNAPVLSEYAVSRLAAHDHPHPFAHVTYGGAGHVFHEPYLDASTVTGAEFGGAPRATATAAADAFPRCLDYLERGLGSG